jgi:hypothetical protein
MTTKYDLDTVDRATLVAWRAWNTIKWSVAALAVAFAAATAFFYALPDFSINLSSRSGALLITVITLVPTVLSAVAIGVIIGRHVAARPFLTAGVVALLHLIASVWIAGHGLNVSAPVGSYILFTPSGGNPGGEQLTMLLVVLVEVYVAAGIARRAWAKRPRALRANA